MRTINEPPLETSGGGFVVFGPTQSVSAGPAQVENLCYGVERGAARAPEPGYGSKRSQDGEAQRTCNERMPRWHPRMSGDGARAAPSLVNASRYKYDPY